MIFFLGIATVLLFCAPDSWAGLVNIEGLIIVLYHLPMCCALLAPGHRVIFEIIIIKLLLSYHEHIHLLG